MPTYGPDGSIRLDTTNEVGSGGVGPHGTSGGPVTAFSDAWFRDDLQAIEGLQADRGYEHYEPGFRHGWEAASRYRGRGWRDAERDVERDWRGQHADRDWQEYRSAIRHAFERAMRTFEGEK